MSKINAASLCAFALTTLVLFVMSHLPWIPVWALFIAWVCFFHMGGEQNANQVWLATNVHMGFGAVASWLSALLLFANPFADGIMSQLWGPAVIGLAIAAIVRLSRHAWLAVTPAVIYGYASIWAFLAVSGRFDLAVLQTLTFDNAAVAIVSCIVFGSSLGYVNAWLVSRLSRGAIQ